MYDEKNSGPAGNDAFIASNGWVTKFLNRNGPSLRRRTTIAQKDPSPRMIDKIVMYILKVRRLNKGSLKISIFKLP